MPRSGHVGLTAVLLSVGAVGCEAVTPGRSAATVPGDRVAWFITAMALLTVVTGVVSDVE